MDTVSSSATIAWVCEAVERGDLTTNDLDGVEIRWGKSEAALALTIKMGEGDGLLETGPLAGVQPPLEQLKRDYYQAMDWDPDTGRLSRDRAEQLGMAELLDAQLA